MAPKYYLIDESQLNAIKRLASRMHSEERMGGDETRNVGHTLTQIYNECKELELPEDLTPP